MGTGETSPPQLLAGGTNSVLVPPQLLVITFSIMRKICMKYARCSNASTVNVIYLTPLSFFVTSSTPQLCVARYITHLQMRRGRRNLDMWSEVEYDSEHAVTGCWAAVVEYRDAARRLEVESGRKNTTGSWQHFCAHEPGPPQLFLHCCAYVCTK